MNSASTASGRVPWGALLLPSILFVLLSSLTGQCHGQVGGIGGVPTGPVLVEFPPPLVTFTNSTGVVVGCRASGDPPPRITWLHLDHTTVTTIPTVREVLSNGSLRILPFGGSEYRQDVHAGVYQCRATNPTGTVLAAPTTLRAVVVQNVEVQVYDEYVMRGNTAVLHCSIPSFVRDLVTVTAWVRNDGFHIYPSHLGGDGKYAAVDEGRLLLVRAVEPGDSYNTYKCRVLHTLTGLTITSKTARVIVHDPRERSAPRMVTKIANLKIRDDDAPLVIPCVAHSHPAPSYKWWMEANGKRTPLDPTAMSSRTGGGGGGSGGGGVSGGGGGSGSSRSGGTGGLQDKGLLVIEPFHSHIRQARTIICEAINEIGRASMEVHISRTVTLGVQVSPKVEVVDSGSTGVLRCQVTSSVGSAAGGGASAGVPGLHHSTALLHGLPPSTSSSGVSLSWYKDGHPLTPTGRVEILENGGLMQIRGVAKEDTGMYQCFARSDHSTVQDAAEVRLGASAPEFIYKFISQILTHGPTVSLKCIATGTPTPTIKWALDGFPLPHNDSSYYGNEGLEYTLGRVPIGGTDFSTHPYTYDDVSKDKSLSSFALQMEDLKYKIPMVLESLDMAEAEGRHIKLFASPWSAPAWMKSNKNIKGKGKLLRKYYSTWAKYLARFLKEYAKHNVSFWGMTLQNEPTDGLLYQFPFNCMGWTPDDQAKWLGKYLGPTLEQEGFAQTKLFILDDNRFFLPKWVDVVMSYPSAARYVYGVAVHWYTDAFTPAALLDMTHKKHPQLPLLYTEACNGQWPWQILKVVLGSWVRAETYASNIIENLNHWATGWTDWNLALDLEGGPNWAENFVDSPIIVNKTSSEFYRQPTFYILAHFSKILPPGSIRMDVSVKGEENQVTVNHVAFRRPDNATAVILLNKHGVDSNVRITDIKGHQLDLTVHAHSIKSVLWQ